MSSNNMMFDSFSEVYVRSLFLDFIIGLFDAYDEDKHYIIIEEDQDVHFEVEQFIEDSKSDIRQFLKTINGLPSFDVFIQNINYVVDKRHKDRLKAEKSSQYKGFKFEENKRIKSAAIYENCDDIYNTFITSLERRKGSKSLEKTFKTKVYNTISVNSPTYEKLPYTQTSIFTDPLHHEMLKHEVSVPMYEFPVDFTFLGVNLKQSQRDFTKSLAKEELAYFKQSKEPSLVQEFKKHIFENKDIINSFYNYLPTKNKTQIINANIHKLAKTGDNKTEKVNTNLMSKENVIEHYNEYIAKYIKQPKIEFHLNFAGNVIQTLSFCDYCSKPNNIWDIRKGFSFSKTKKETRTKCKFCNNSFVPYFLIIEDGESNSRNRSFDAKNRKTEFNEIPTDLISTKNTLDASKKIKKVEYMSFEHLMSAYVENSVNAGDELSKKKSKFPYGLYYNLWLLMGEVLIRIEGGSGIGGGVGSSTKLSTSKTTVFTFHDYLKKLIPFNEYDKNSNFTLAKFMKDSEYKNIMEANEKQRQLESKKYSVLKKDSGKKNVNVKFELKDITNGDRFKEFEKNLADLRKAKKEAKEIQREQKITKWKKEVVETLASKEVSESYVDTGYLKVRARSRSTLVTDVPITMMKRNSNIFK
jgi:hypothetical protein